MHAGTSNPSSSAGAGMCVRSVGFLSCSSSSVMQEFWHHTFERYSTSKKHTEEFMRWKYKVNDLDIRKLKYEFIANYEFWLKSVRKCDHNTAIK